MKKLLLAAVSVVALTASAHAAVIQNLGVNPSSAQGEFSNAVGGTTFEDQYTFQLLGAPAFITFASATNVFAAPSDFITGFTGQLYQQVGAIDANGGIGVQDDIGFGAVPAVLCSQAPVGCQILAGVAQLLPGNYYLELSGIGGGTSGYGGNLTVAAVPVPAMGAGILPLIGAAAWFARRRRKELAA